MATAFGVRALGTALVVICGFCSLQRQETRWASFYHCQCIEVDYQSGPERPHSKGSADLIYAQASNNQAFAQSKLEVTIKGDAQAQPDSALVAAIRETYSDHDYGDVRYFLKWFDLNGDGDPEAIVYVVGPRVCGTGGCDTHIFARREGGYKLVSTISLTRPLIIASQRRAHGWRNLIVFVAGGGILPGYYAELQFDGRTYPENPTVEPAKRVKGQPRGEALIKRFRSYLEGKPLNPKGGSDKR